jgi:hypothetical protein
MADHQHHLVSNPYSIEGLIEPRLRDDSSNVDGRRLDFASFVQQVTDEALLENDHLVKRNWHDYALTVPPKN